MDIVLICGCIILLIVGIVGAVVPIIQGPLFSWLALLTLHFHSKIQFSTTTLVVTAVIMAIVIALDFYVPVWGTKKLGGTKYGMWGSTIGLLVAMLFLPMMLFLGPIPLPGVIIGPFVGAWIGEMMNEPKNQKKAFKSALGSLVGFLFGTGLKLMYSFGVIFFIAYKVWFAEA